MNIYCPNCNNLLYIFDEEEGAYNIGSPLGKCSKCNSEYLDRRYREIALEEDPPSLEIDGDIRVVKQEEIGRAHV